MEGSRNNFFFSGRLGLPVDKAHFAVRVSLGKKLFLGPHIDFKNHLSSVLMNSFTGGFDVVMHGFMGNPVFAPVRGNADMIETAAANDIVDFIKIILRL